MMYHEFINLTGFGETYITHENYSTAIEPVYMALDIDKQAFCSKFYQAHKRLVTAPVNMVIAAKTTQELEQYLVDKSPYIMRDVEEVHAKLKNTFLMLWKKTNGNPEERI